MLSLPLVDAKGNYNGHLGNTIHKIWETSLDRVRGSVVTRNESRNLTAQMNLTQNIATSDGLSLEQIEEKLRLMDQSGQIKQIKENEEDAIEIDAEPTEL